MWECDASPYKIRQNRLFPCMTYPQVCSGASVESDNCPSSEPENEPDRSISSSEICSYGAVSVAVR